MLTPGVCLSRFRVFFDLLTSLYGALLSLRVGKGVDKVGKGAMAAEQLLVGAALGNFSICHNQNMVGLWQEAHPVGHKNPGLNGEPHECRKKNRTLAQSGAEKPGFACEILLSGRFHVIIKTKGAV